MMAHPYLFAVVFVLVVFGCGFHCGVKFCDVQVRRLRQANQTLRMMLHGVPFDGLPPARGKGVEAAEARSRAWWIARRARLKAEGKAWQYQPRRQLNGS